MCGCKRKVKSRKKYIEGHYLRYYRKHHKPWNYGKKMSDEYRQKLSIAHKGQKLTKAQRKKISDALKGRKLSKINKIRIGISNSIALKGVKHPLWRRKAFSKIRKKYLKEHPEKHPTMIILKNKGVTKGQKFLYKQIKKVFPEAVVKMDYRVKRSLTACPYFIDVAIPQYLLGFEYDGKFWHKGREKYEKERDANLKMIGWNILRIKES